MVPSYRRPFLVAPDAKVIGDDRVDLKVLALLESSDTLRVDQIGIGTQLRATHKRRRRAHQAQWRSPSLLRVAALKFERIKIHMNMVKTEHLAAIEEEHWRSRTTAKSVALMAKVGRARPGTAVLEGVGAGGGGDGGGGITCPMKQFRTTLHSGLLVRE